MSGAGRYKPYPTYKASYAVWSGDVPEHWAPMRLKHVFTDKKKRPDPTLPAGSISFGNVIYKNEDSLAKETKAAYQVLEDGEFLVNPLNMNYDLLSLRTALSSINVVVSTGYMILQSAEGYHKNYLRWLLQQFDVAHMKTLGAGVRQTISYTDIGNSYIFQPPLPEQTQIAAFLDYETVQIDALIAKQQRLIALLEEKRQAVISHAVTKGLDPTAPLRPSGIDWLGDVPAHWEVMKLKRVVSVKGGYAFSSDSFADTGKKVIRIGDIDTRGNVSLENAKCIPATMANQFKAYEVQAGHILMAMTGATIGKAGWYLDHEPALLNQRVGAFECDEGSIGSRFFWYVLKSEGYQKYVTLTAFGGAQPNISDTQMLNYPFVLPKLLEQRGIADFLNDANSRFDALADKAQSAITLLKERRTALISAAVTGKIDVRDWQAPEGTQPHSTTDSNQPQEAPA